MPVVSDTYAEYFARKRATIAGSLVSAAGSLAAGALGNRYISGLSSGASKIGSTITDVLDARLAPDIVNSTSNDISPTLSRGYYDFIYYYNMPINATELCDFWALYGYPYNKPAKLSDVIKTRYRFNYVKTAAAKLPSITYNEHKVKLEQLLNAGITFWHDHAGTIATIRDYSKENAEISLL
jgi:hypothetical protein